MVCRPDHAVGDVAVLTDAGGVEDLHRHDRHARVRDTGDVDPVVSRCCDDAGHRRAVAVGIGRWIGACKRRVAGNQFSGKVRVTCVDAGVEHCHRCRRRRRDAAEDVVPAYRRKRPLT